MGNYYAGIMNASVDSSLKHFGILGQKWGVRRFQNPDGSLTPAGRERYGRPENVGLSRKELLAKYDDPDYHLSEDQLKKKYHRAGGLATEMAKVRKDTNNEIYNNWNKRDVPKSAREKINNAIVNSADEAMHKVIEDPTSRGDKRKELATSYKYDHLMSKRTLKIINELPKNVRNSALLYARLAEKIGLAHDHGNNKYYMSGYFDTKTEEPLPKGQTEYILPSILMYYDLR